MTAGRPCFKTRSIFEPEETDDAPEPSIGCWLRNHHEREFTLLYLQAFRKLLVSREPGTATRATVRDFIAEFPQLEAYLEYGGPNLSGQDPIPAS